MTTGATGPQHLLDVDADHPLTSWVSMLAAADAADFDAVLHTVLESFAAGFGLGRLVLHGAAVPFACGDHTRPVEQRVVPAGAAPLALDVAGVPGRPVSPAAVAVGRAVLGWAAAAADRLATAQRLRHLLEYDELTGLLNRTGFRAALAGVVGAAAAPLLLLWTDVDRLTAVDAAFGSDAVDTVLRAVGARFRDALPDGTPVGRVGGDEFAAVLPLGDGDPHQVAETVRARLQQPVRLPAPGAGSDPAEVFRTVTVGAAASDGGRLAATELTRRAATALEAGKRRGGAVTVTYDASMRRTDDVRRILEMRIGRALVEGELTLDYQPEVDLRTGVVVGAEALVRWRHPELGLLLPDTFIATVEASPYALRFGRWVLEAACRRWGSWLDRLPRPDDGTLPRVRVNVTATQLMSADFVDTVADVLHGAALPAAALGLEITERDVVRDQAAAEHTLRGLVGLGVTVALDDFGTGYSSFGQLRRFTVSAVKIDRSFVSGLATDPDDRAIVTSVVSLARSLGLDVVAEGVQDPVAAQLLVGMGCLRGQGFLYGPPLCPEAFEALLDPDRVAGC